ncbi:MAG: holin [Clostridia bacterium]|nr:holin [Clostridia bacterium]
MIDLTPIFQAILALLAALITAFAIPWIRSKTTLEQREMLLSITTSLIYAAEQLYGAGKGHEKMEYVIGQLEERGYTADIAAIEAIIKEQYDLLHNRKIVETDPPDGD